MPKTPRSPKAQSNTPKGYRPLGLTIAILAAAITYGLGPLTFPISIVIVQIRKNDILSLMSGLNANIPGWPLDVGVSLVVFASCVLAWRGRPAWGRWALIAVVWIAAAEQVITTLQAQAPTTYASSIVDLSRQFRPCQITLNLLVPAYITWFLNRSPARTFYRDRATAQNS